MAQTTADKVSAWSPLRITLFRALWLATLISNIGTWMHDIGAGGLMTSLSPLPVFLLALPTGALSVISTGADTRL